MLYGDTFVFGLGQEGKAVTVHRSLFRDVSDPLYKMMNGPMTESQAGTAYLPDVDHELFVAVCEFAYTGSIQETLRREKAKDTHDPNSTKGENLLRENLLRENLGLYTKGCLHNFLSPHTDFPSADVICPSMLEFLVNLALLSQRYLLPKLVEISINYIRGALVKYKLDPEEPHFLMHIIEHVHDNGGAKAMGDESASLEARLMQYTACQWGLLKNSAKFEEFLKANPEICMQLVRTFGEVEFPNGDSSKRKGLSSKVRKVVNWRNDSADDLTEGQLAGGPSAFGPYHCPPKAASGHH